MTLNRCFSFTANRLLLAIYSQTEVTEGQRTAVFDKVFEKIFDVVKSCVDENKLEFSNATQ